MLAINELVDRAINCELTSPRLAYLAPLRKQAKLIAWDYLKRYTTMIPGRAINEAELRVDLPGDRRIYVEGADNPDALRGVYLDGAVLDEFGQMQPAAWREVVRPALSDRRGWALFIGTPKGRNAFHDLYESARKAMEEGDPDWFAALYRASDTGILPPDEIASLKRDMDEDEFEQELQCSFTAAIAGAYYSKELGAAEREGRITGVPWEPSHPVHTAWDLGIDDSTAIWFAQWVGRELRLIDYLESSGEALGFYVKALKERPYVYGDHLLPHDGEARELGTGKTRIETLASLGVRATVVPRQEVEDGINAVRQLLPKAWFDAKKCARGLDTLRNYQREWNEKLGVFKSQPRHDWASHGADAFRALAMGLKAPAERRDHRQSQVSGVGAWMA